MSIKKSCAKQIPPGLPLQKGWNQTSDVTRCIECRLNFYRPPLVKGGPRGIFLDAQIQATD